MQYRETGLPQAAPVLLCKNVMNRYRYKMKNRLLPIALIYSILIFISCERNPVMQQRENAITMKGNPLTLLGTLVEVGQPHRILRL